MKLFADGNIWAVESNYAEKDAVKAAGFRWDPKEKRWWTNDRERAAKLVQFADDSCRAELAGVADAKTEALAASRAAASDAEFPAPDGLSYLPYQRAGISYALSRPGTLIGDDMGLGKTIQGIGVINADDSIRSVLVICPASLKLNWKKELTKWLVRPATIGIANGTFPDTDIVAINFDILAKHHDAIRARSWDLLIVDEAHALKNPDAIRTQQVIGRKEKKKKDKKGGEPKVIPAISPIAARRRVFMTGTPICNRPLELWPLVSSLDPDGLGKSFFSFATRYCNGHQGRFGWDFSGSSNLDELQEKLRTSIMVRRTKSQVLTELPPKRRQIIEMPANGATQLIEAEGRVWKLHEDALADLRARVELAKASDDPAVFEGAVKALTKAAAVAFDEISKCRHDVALAKVPHVVEHLRDAIESSGKVVLFCHHRDMVEAISAEFPGAAIIHGGIAKIEERQAAVERFQTDPSCQLFIGTIGAAGVGHTLTAASHVVFAELDWVPGLVTQAEDRCHRIGQTDTVLVQHLVLEGSLDAKMAQTLVNKQNVIDAALDKHHPARVEMEKLVVIPGAESATERTSRKQVEEEAVHLTPAQVDAIHAGLRILAGFDSDFARSKNDMGFSKIDVRIGHSLAEAPFLSPKQAALGRKLVAKYRRQVPADLLETINGCEAA